MHWSQRKRGCRMPRSEASPGYDPTLPADGPTPERVRVNARGRRHSLSHLYAERFLQYDSWAGRNAWWDSHVPSRSGPSCWVCVLRTAGGRPG